mgnify:FL=1
MSIRVGGKCDEIINHNNVIIDGRSNFPGTMPMHSSQLYAKNVYNLLNHMFKEEKKLNMEDEITNGSILINKGIVNNKILQQFLDQEK